MKSFSLFSEDHLVKTFHGKSGAAIPVKSGTDILIEPAQTSPSKAAQTSALNQ
jgi:hypothetical protein